MTPNPFLWWRPPPLSQAELFASFDTAGRDKHLANNIALSYKTVCMKV